MRSCAAPIATLKRSGGDPSPFHIAWIGADDEDETVSIVVYDALEYRVPVFEADTRLSLDTGPGAIAERAREALQIDGGFTVHTMEPHGAGFRRDR